MQRIWVARKNTYCVWLLWLYYDQHQRQLGPWLQLLRQRLPTILLRHYENLRKWRGPWDSICWRSICCTTVIGIRPLPNWSRMQLSWLRVSWAVGTIELGLCKSLVPLQKLQSSQSGCLSRTIKVGKLLVSSDIPTVCFDMEKHRASCSGCKNC